MDSKHKYGDAMLMRFCIHVQQMLTQSVWFDKSDSRLAFETQIKLRFQFCLKFLWKHKFPGFHNCNRCNTFCPKGAVSNCAIASIVDRTTNNKKKNNKHTYLPTCLPTCLPSLIYFLSTQYFSQSIDCTPIKS